MKNFSPNDTDLAVLSQLDTENYKEAKEVHKAEEVREEAGIGVDQTRNILKDYSSNNSEIAERRGNSPMSFRLTAEGEKQLVREKSSPTADKYGDKTLDYGKMVEEFTELIQNYQQKQENYIKEHSDKEIEITEIEEDLAAFAAKASRTNILSIPVSFRVIDFFNFELAEEMKENFDVALEALREAFQRQSVAPDNIEDLHIKVVDIPEEETEEITSLRSRHIGKLVKLRGQLDIVTQVTPEVVSAIFECSQCGERYEKEQDSSELKSPYKCECGSRKFEKEDKIMQDSRVIRIKTQTSTKGNETIRGRIEGLAVDEFDNLYSKIGKNTEISGHLKEIPQEKNSKKYDFILEVNNIEFVDDNWKVEPLTNDRIQELEQLRDQLTWEEWKNKILESFAPHIKHRKPLKTTIILWLNGRNDAKIRGDKTPNNLNICVIGEPGIAKTQIIKWAVKHLPKTDRGSGEGATGVGITAAVTKDEYTGDFRAEAGLIPQMHNGFVAIDEFDKLSNDDRTKLNTIMSDQEFEIHKANIHETILADVGIIAAANPELDSFEKFEPKTSQIPIDDSQDSILNRFHFFLFAESGFEDDEKNKEVNEAVLKQGEPEEKLEDEGEEIEPPLQPETVVDILRHAQSFEPFTPKNIRDDIDEFFQEHKAVFENTKVIMNKRQLKGMKMVARAFARLDFSETVEEKHLEEMKDFYRVIAVRAMPEDTEDSEGDALGQFLGKQPQTNQGHQKGRINQIKKVLKELGGDEEPVSEKKVLNSLNSEFDEDYLEEMLENMKKDGEVFEPESGLVQLS